MARILGLPFNQGRSKEYQSNEGKRVISHVCIDLLLRKPCRDDAVNEEMLNYRAWFGEASKGKVSYNSNHLELGVMSGRNPFFYSECFQAALPKFFECITPHDDVLMFAPVFYGLFSRPSSVLVDYLSRMRSENSLPVPEGEPVPGAWGLRSKETYVLALHYRGAPLGFEPMSPVLRSRYHQLQAFWGEAKEAAAKAREVAKCRNKALIIYLATDDPATLRPMALEILSEYGKVVFGLAEEDVGHSSPQWSERDKDYVRRAHDNATYAAEIKHAANKPHQVIVKPPLSDAQTEKHGVTSLVEWWVISQSNWLLANGLSEYSYTAAGLGLSPRGAMEKYSYFVSEDAADAHVLLRRDWAGNPCSSISAESPEVALECPNL